MDVIHFMKSTPWLMVVAVCAIVFLCSYFLKCIVIGRLSKIAHEKRSKTLIIKAMNKPLNILLFALVLFVAQLAMNFAELLTPHIESYLFLAIKICLILAIVFCVDGFISLSIAKYAKKSAAVRNSQTILKGINKLILICIGTLIILDTLAISITPIIASLGITSLAVALALQPTLSNFFSGIQLVIDKPMRVGDFIELDSGEQGFVEKIGWRSTWIKMLPNNIVIMPNSKLSDSKIINYYYPEKELSVPVEVSVHYDSDLEFVERVTLEVAKEILISHEWGIDDYDTFVLFHTFDSSSINFTVMLRAQEYFNRFFIKSAFIKALHKRYAEEGIVIPYPIRAINTSQEEVHNNG